MLLIVSEKGDLSTNDVIDWLVHNHTPFIRLNADESEEIEMLVENTPVGVQCKIKTDQHCFLLSEISAYWYRRGGIPQFKIPGSSIEEAFEKDISRKIKDYLNCEAQTLYEFIHSVLDKLPNKIGSSSTAGVNKLNVLEKAEGFGLKVPKWCVTMKTAHSRNFIEQEGGEVITKGIWESLIASTDSSGFSTYTELINLTSLDTFPKNHFPSLLQNKINKKYEVRSFYLLGKFWSMAIFSQKDSQTAIDFRKYNEEKPNRNVPFNLPTSVECKLKKLMKALGLETGSIDLIVDENDDFIFLEVNPVGQFGMTSSPCNYNLEKIIAQQFNFKTNL